MRYKIAFWAVFVATLMVAFCRSTDAGLALIVGAVLGVIGLWVDDETSPGYRVLGPPRPDPLPCPKSFTANPDAKGYPPRPRPIPWKPKGP